MTRRHDPRGDVGLGALTWLGVVILAALAFARVLHGGIYVPPPPACGEPAAIMLTPMGWSAALAVDDDAGECFAVLAWGDWSPGGVRMLASVRMLAQGVDPPVPSLSPLQQCIAAAKETCGAGCVLKVIATATSCEFSCDTTGGCGHQSPPTGANP